MGTVWRGTSDGNEALYPGHKKRAWYTFSVSFFVLILALYGTYLRHIFACLISLCSFVYSLHGYVFNIGIFFSLALGAGCFLVLALMEVKRRLWGRFSKLYNGRF